MSTQVLRTPSRRIYLVILGGARGPPSRHGLCWTRAACRRHASASTSADRAEHCVPAEQEHHPQRESRIVLSPKRRVRHRSRGLQGRDVGLRDRKRQDVSPSTTSISDNYAEPRARSSSWGRTVRRRQNGRRRFPDGTAVDCAQNVIIRPARVPRWEQFPSCRCPATHACRGTRARRSPEHLLADRGGYVGTSCPRRCGIWQQSVGDRSQNTLSPGKR